MSFPHPACSRLIHEISTATEPGRMSTSQAKEVYEYLISWLEGSLEALEDEQDEETEEEGG